MLVKIFPEIKDIGKGVIVEHSFKANLAEQGTELC